MTHTGRSDGVTDAGTETVPGTEAVPGTDAGGDGGRGGGGGGVAGAGPEAVPGTDAVPGTAGGHGGVAGAGVGVGGGVAGPGTDADGVTDGGTEAAPGTDAGGDGGRGGGGGGVAGAGPEAVPGTDAVPGTAGGHGGVAGAGVGVGGGVAGAGDGPGGGGRTGRRRPPRPRGAGDPPEAADVANAADVIDVIDVVDVVALGESMVTFLPSRPGRLSDVPVFTRAIGGAESNVACVLAAAGHSARWVSRVGADGFGDHLVAAVGAHGVDVTRVPRDPARPTGVYFRTAGERGTDAHEVAYYRAGSAASAMSAGSVDLAAVRAGRVLHLSGITAALSASCRALLGELLRPAPGRPLVSFDVNHRPGLWRTAGDPRVLLDLARGADLVFVGEDEAAEAWGVTGGPHAVREALPEPPVLVVKQAEHGVTVFEAAARADGGAGTPETVTFVPSPHVTVVASVGAGDAFAAGFLSATLRGLPVRERARHGHLMAAAALTAPGDLARPPARAHADRLAALDDTAWAGLRLGPGWTQAAGRTAEEVRTP